ncbi:uncharacterized protein B0P05DRAFT_520796 [Gilbertella persicaria]|uniref:uncharacterized protein n=1 Tax=Gilbertella persicaria TaxID=101096 RepID=UPI00221E83F8|nr:uncharacterized protein B0P05DRAFT_520796 [Gilbertella persicaria]KAI8098174.1 hypothetical protein B0P05DRAFT_520796 [Gilbertella persicaria]
MINNNVELNTHEPIQTDKRISLYEMLKDEDTNLPSSIETESMSSNSFTVQEDEQEIIHYESDNDSETMILGVKKEGYRRMNLKEESESDKDLIIYSLNESLHIHKEIVERIQQEKDDLEYYYEETMREREKALLDEQKQIEEQQEKSKEKLGRLQNIYHSLMSELEANKLEYRRMENRFNSHVKKDQTDQPLSTTQSQIQSLLSRIESIASMISSSQCDFDYVKNRWPSLTEYEEDKLIPLFIQKLIMEIILEQIFYTSIHPGVSLNQAFGNIHQWVDKRNTSWASRMKQQITSFIVKQSKEEAQEIEAAEQGIVNELWTQLDAMVNLQDNQDSKEELTAIVKLSASLNIVMKCQENPTIDIVRGIRPNTAFDQETMEMVSVPGLELASQDEQKRTVSFVISPPFVAQGHDGFLIPAKVYCL